MNNRLFDDDLIGDKNFFETDCKFTQINLC
jgi:hypothetical protein